MTAEHYAEVELYEDGEAFVRFVCTGGADDLCHQWCAEGCEESCTAPPRRHPADALNFVPGTVILSGHRWADTGSCRIADWLDAVGWQDTGWVDEPDAGGEREVTVRDLREGRHRIEEEWTGDDYIWRYPAAAAEPAS